MLDLYKHHRRECIAFIVLFALMSLYIATHPRGASTYVMTIWANQCLILALAAMAQFFVVLVRGIDLSVGAIMALSNCVASYVLVGSGIDLFYGSIAVVLTGTLCGALNGLIVVYGRIQPIIVTLATGSVFIGIALLLRPTPGGTINYDFADAMTLDIAGIPTAIIICAVLLIGFWIPLRRSGLGRAFYAIGSSEQAAFQSGISVNTVRIFAFAMGGTFAGLAGSYFSYVTATGDAGIAANFTLNSIAAVVLGGVAQSGGVGSLVGALLGACILKTISSLMFFSGLPPLAQPLIEGVVLAGAIAIGSSEVLRMKNRLQVFDR